MPGCLAAYSHPIGRSADDAIWLEKPCCLSFHLPVFPDVQCICFNFDFESPENDLKIPKYYIELFERR